MAFILILYYSAINAVVVEIAMKVGFDFQILGFKITTYVCILLINIAAIRIYIRGVHFSNLQKLFALYITVFILLSIRHDPNWILKDFLYIVFITLPSIVISMVNINFLISYQKYFIRINIIALGIICALLIILSPNNIELRASLQHLNANTYSTFGAYLLLSAIAYPNHRIGGYLTSLSCIILALGVLSYANSVGITLILLGTLFFALFSGLKRESKGLACLSILLLIATTYFSKSNVQKISIIDRAETLVKNTSSTLYDRLSVYDYVVQNYWDHFFIGSNYNLQGIITAHNIFIEIFLISGFFGATIFILFTIISSLRWLKALTRGNEALIYIALLYIFSLVEALFRGRLVYSVLLMTLMAASFGISFMKFLSETKKNNNNEPG